jgi:hypothetical protein
MEIVDIQVFYGHVEYFYCQLVFCMAFWYFAWPFGILCAHLVPTYVIYCHLVNSG